MTATDAAARLPFTVEEGWRRGSGWTATYGSYPYSIETYGKTAAEAKAAMAEALATALDTMLTHKPRFGRDDDGTLLAAIPAPDGGSTHWRINDTGAYPNTVTSTPSEKAFDECYHQTPIPYRSL